MNASGGRGLGRWGVTTHPHTGNHLSVKDYIREMLEEDRELMAKLG